MMWIDALSFAAAILVVGTCGAFLFENAQESSLARRAGLVLTCGAGGLGYLFFLLGLGGLHPGRSPFLGCLILVAWYGVAAFRRMSAAVPSWWARTSLRSANAMAIGILCGLLILAQGIVTLHALAFPLYEWDGFAVWGFKAKVIALQGIAPKPAYFFDLSQSYSHLDYPLMVPLLMAGVSYTVGHFDDQLAKLCFPLLYFGLMCVVYDFSRRRLSAVSACAVTLITMAAPVMLRWSGSGGADLPLAAFSTTAAVCLCEWDASLRWRSAALCGVMSAFAAFTKNEGIAIGMIVYLVLLAFSIAGEHRTRRLSGVGVSVAIFFLLLVPWLVWSFDLPRSHESYPDHLRYPVIFGNVSRIPQILGAFARQIIDFRTSGLLWIVLALAAALGWRGFRDRGTIMIWLLLVQQVALYAVILLITPWDLQALMDVVLDRLVLHVVPLGGMLIAMHLSAAGEAGLRK